VPSIANPKAKSIIPAVAESLHPNLSTMIPDKGRAKRAPTGLTSKTAPNSLSLKLKLSFISGILDAQIEKHRPLWKNSAFRAILSFVFSSYPADSYFFIF
jgi:hypothetical protein